jgi:hypothetical protein
MSWVQVGSQGLGNTWGCYSPPPLKESRPEIWVGILLWGIKKVCLCVVVPFVQVVLVAELPELFQLKCLSPALEARPHLNGNNPSIPRI